jgi:hypothetical protein
MLLPHSFLKYFQSAQKEVKIASNCFFVRLNTLKHTTLREVMVNSLYSKPTFFQKERMDKDHLLDVGDISEFKQVMPEFLSELGEQVLLMREKREILDFTDKLKEQSLRLQTAKGKYLCYLCDITFVFFEEKDMFHVYLSVNSKEVEEQNFDKKVFIPRNYRERLKGSVFTNEAKIKSFRFLPLILNNYNCGTKVLEEVEFNGYTIDHEWFKDMIVAPLLKFAKKPSLFLGEFKTEEVRKVYEKLFSIYENKEIQANKEVSFGLVLEEFTKHFNLNRNALRLFELCYLLGNSKTIYDRQLNKPIIFTDRKVTNNEDKIAKLLEDNNKLEALEKALYQINDSYQLRDNVRDKIKENLNLINSLSIKEENEEDTTEDDFENFISSLENKVKGEDQDYGFLNLLLILRMMNIVKFS